MPSVKWNKDVLATQFFKSSVRRQGVGKNLEEGEEIVAWACLWAVYFAENAK